MSSEKLPIIPGTRFGYLTVETKSNISQGGRLLYVCRCDCGRQILVSKNQLTGNAKKSCGDKSCYFRNLVKRDTGRHGVDRTGNVQGKITVLRRAPFEIGKPRSWICTCSCNPEKEITLTNDQLARGIKSCGKCGYLQDRIIETRQKYKTQEELELSTRYDCIKERCSIHGSHRKNYYDRDIKMCQEWLDNKRAFIDWSLANGYKKELTIDRIDNDGPYAPWNCRWVDQHVQSNNKSTNIHFTIDGTTRTMTDWASYEGIDYSTISRLRRFKGDDVAIDYIKEQMYENLIKDIENREMVAPGVVMNDVYQEDVTCVTHTDSDGHLAGYLVKRKYGKHAKIIYSNYGREIPNYAFNKMGKLFVTDFSLTLADFNKAKHLGMTVIWLDHHKSNIDELHNAGIALQGIQDPSHSGSYWTFHYLYPGVEKPRVIRLIDSYDLWKFDEPGTLEFQMGLKMFETRVTYHGCFIWDKLLSDDQEEANKTIDYVIELGKKILTYTAIRNKTICNDLAYVCEYNEQRVVVANVKQANSKFFDSFDRSTVDAMSMLQYSPDIKGYRTSLYSPDDHKPVIQIAKSFGGGGHDCACGFQGREYPWPMPIRQTPRPMADVIDDYATLTVMRNDVVIGQSCFRSDKISLMSAVYKGIFMMKDCLAINHPYISELIRVFPSQVDLINPRTGSFFEFFVGYSLVKTGQFRIGVYYIDQVSAPNLQDFETRLKNVPGGIGEISDLYEENLGQLGKVFWFYWNNDSRWPVVPLEVIG